MIKNIGIIEHLGGIGSSLLAALASTANFVEGSKGPRGGKRSKVRGFTYAYREQPEDVRHWHKPTELRQLDAIEAAEAKREARGAKRQRDAEHSTNGYLFGRESGLSVSQICIFDQLYIAK